MQGYSLGDAASAEQRHTGKTFNYVAICFTISSVVYYAVSALVFIITMATVFGIIDSASSYS